MINTFKSFMVVAAFCGCAIGRNTCAADEAKPLYENNFEAAAVGSVPADFLVSDGAFAVREEGGNKFLELPGAPLDSFGVFFGPTLKTDVAVSARIKGTHKGRRYPTFGVGLNGQGGYKLRVSPGKKALEIYKGDNLVASAPYDWKSGEWTFMRLQIVKSGDAWKVDGKAWLQGATEPAQALVAFEEKQEPSAGRASIWGSPYATTPIQYDDLKVIKVEPANKARMLRWFEHAQVYHPNKEWVATGAELGRPFQDIFFNASDGVRLSAWFFPADADSPRRRFAVLICHGNGGNISHRLELCRLWLQAGVNVLVFDYRGFGHSEGAVSEEGTYRDAQAAHAWLRQQGFAPENIIVFGESLGGGIAGELAVREPVGGLVLQSTFTSIADVGAEIFPWLPVRWLNTIKYDTLKKLARVRAPVLVMHSREDGLIGFRHAERNFAAANEPKLFWEIHGDHNYSLSLEPQRWAEGVESFLQLVEAAQQKERENARQPD